MPPLLHLKCEVGAPVVAQRLTNPTGIHEDMVPSLALLSGLGIWRCFELWSRSQMRLRSCIAVAAALIQSLAWELPYAVGMALKKTKKKNVKSLIQASSVYSAMTSRQGPWTSSITWNLLEIQTL